MKKLLSVILAAVIAVSCVSVAFAAITPARYIVSALYACAYAEPKSNSEMLFEVAGNTYVSVIREENGYLLADVPSKGTGWIFASSLTYAGTASSTDVSAIYVAAYPNKTEYVETEESFEPDGLIVKARLKKGGEKTVDGSELAIYTESFNSVGTKSVTVLYREPSSGAVFTTSFTVKTVRVPVTGITAVKLPSKTEYIENQPLDISGAELRATFSDGRADVTFTATNILSDENFTVTVDGGKTDKNKLTVGTHTVTVTYRYTDISCSFDITVKEKTLRYFYVSTEPDSLTVYSLDTVPSLKGLTLIAEFDNGEKYTLTSADCDVICSLPLHYGSGNKVTVKYGKMAVTLDFTARPLEEKRLKLTLPQVLTFILGEEIDLSGIKAEIEYTDGSVKEVTGWKMSEIEPLNTAKRGQDVVVSYGMFSETFTIFIVPEYQRGDIDGDGKVSVSDARYALRQAVGLIQLAVNSKPYTAADADMNGTVSVSDARLILRGAVGLEKLPLALYAKG